MNDLTKISVPGKLILFGEWSVLFGHAGIGVPLKTSFELSAEPAHKTSMTSNNIPDERNLLESDPWVRSSLQVIQNHFQNSDTFCFNTLRNWPLHEGLGSSSALFLSLYEFFEHLSKRKSSWDEVLTVFKSIPENNGSGLDLAIQRYRKSLIYQNFSPSPYPIDWPHEHLFLLHGQKKSVSRDAIKKQFPKDEQIVKIKNSTQTFVSSSKKNIDWIEAIETHYETLLEMNVVPLEAQNLLTSQNKKNLKIEALKTVGAGGMDGLLVWTASADVFFKNRSIFEQLGWYLSPHKIL